MDILTIQPLTLFLKKLSDKGSFSEEKVRVVLNKYIKTKEINENLLIGGISIYNDAAMSNRKELFDKCNLEVGSVLFFIANKKEKVAARFAGQIRTELGRKLELIDPNKYEFCIINDFPMFEYNEEEGKYDFCHNPFSMPHGGIEALTKENMDSLLAYQYDFVCNGNEMASGAVRNHSVPCLEKAFELVGYTKDVVEKRFSSLYNAFQYGAPPHAGMAPGIDRIIMLLRDEPNLREVQAFPMSVSGMDAMMGCPSEVSEQQLREIHIKIR